jgi:hypothetical protein
VSEHDAAPAVTGAGPSSMGDAGHHGSGPRPGWLPDYTARALKPDGYWAQVIARIVPLELGHGRENFARHVLGAVASFAGPDSAGGMVARVSRATLVAACPHGTIARNVSEALGDLTVDGGPLAVADPGRGARPTAYRLVCWDWARAERDRIGPSNGPVSGPSNGPVSGPSNGPSNGPSVWTTRGALEETRGEGKRAQVAGQVPVPGGAGLPPPTKSEISKTNPDEPDPGCDVHGWDNATGAACGGCGKAKVRRQAADAERKAALEAEKADYRARYAASVDRCGHDSHPDPGGAILRPGGDGPVCPECRKRWERGRAPAAAPPKRVAGDVIPVGGLVLGSLPALRIVS